MSVRQISVFLENKPGMLCAMTQVLAREKIFKTSFSKYGEAYRQILHGNTQGGLCYA